MEHATKGLRSQMGTRLRWIITSSQPSQGCQITRKPRRVWWWISASNNNASSSPRRWCGEDFSAGWKGLSYLASALNVHVHQARKGHIKSIDFVCWRMREYENKRRSKRMAEFWENSVCINFEKTAYYFENINLISIRSTSRNHVSCLLLIHVAVICIIRSVKS